MLNYQRVSQVQIHLVIFRNIKKTTSAAHFQNFWGTSWPPKYPKIPTVLPWNIFYGKSLWKSFWIFWVFDLPEMIEILFLLEGSVNRKSPWSSCTSSLTVLWKFHMFGKIEKPIHVWFSDTPKIITCLKINITYPYISQLLLPSGKLT